MKNIFKFMGIALMASALFVACSDDENGDDPQPQNQSSYTITFGGQTQNTPVHEGHYIDQTANGFYVLQHIAAAGIDGEDYVTPIFYTGIVNYQNQFWISEQVGLSRYFPNAVLDETETVWYPDSFLGEPTYGTFDATTNTFSCNLGLTVYDYDTWYALMSQLIEADGLTWDDLGDEDINNYDSQIAGQYQTKPYVVDLQNITFTLTQMQ